MTENNKAICIYSPKGGVGKTFVATSLAATSFLMDKKTLLIDFDLYNGSLCLFVNENINKSILSLSKDITTKKYEKLSNYVYKYNEKIDILCAPKDYRIISAFNIKHIKKILEDALAIYDLVIIDTYSILDDLNMELFKYSSEILFILNNDMSNIKNLRNQIKVINNETDYKYKVLLNTSFDKKSEFFSAFEIKQILNANIDYTLSKFSFVKNITNSIYSACIPLLDKRNIKLYGTTFDRFKLIIKDLEKEDNGKD